MSLSNLVFGYYALTTEGLFTSIGVYLENDNLLSVQLIEMQERYRWEAYNGITNSGA